MVLASPAAVPPAEDQPLSGAKRQGAPAPLHGAHKTSGDGWAPTWGTVRMNCCVFVKPAERRKSDARAEQS